MSFLGKLFAAAFCLAALGASGGTTNHYSNAASVKGWVREQLTYNSVSNSFSRKGIPDLVRATASKETANVIGELYDVSTNSIATNLAPVHVQTTNFLSRPLVRITGAAGLDNLLDRDNLTMAVVSNEVTLAADGKRTVTAWVASNKLLRSAPIMKARLRAIEGSTDEWIDAEWADGYTNATPLTLTHPQGYTNFVVAVTTNEIPVITTNVVYIIDGAITNTTEIVLTNQVLAVYDGAQARIVRSGDHETLYCHPLRYTLPKVGVAPDLSRWVKVGDPDKGFDYGNRSMRINGAMTVTTNDLNFLGDWQVIQTNGVPISVTNDFTFFADNGLIKITEKSTNTTENVTE